jgi:hypothetical protein
MTNSLLANIAPSGQLTDYPAMSSAGVAPQETTFFGATIPGTISDTAHVWTATSSGLFTTTADLATEWKNAYSAMMAGSAATLGFIQRLEGNAEAVFENTGLAKLEPGTLVRDRMDVQREFDAIGAAMNELGFDAKAPLTTQNYLAIENTIIGDLSLEELAMQGHGLNSPSTPKYNGYTNDFQNNVDNSTLYVGGGLNNNQAAIPDFFDDDILTHLPFPTVARNGQLEQLNQNGDVENTLAQTVGAVDQFGASMTLTSADFSTSPSSASSTTAAPPEPTPTALPANEMTTLFGATISTTQIVNGHTWIADPNGLFETTADLATEWATDYQAMINGQGNTLSPVQHLEGNAWAVFQNTGLAKLAQSDSDQVSYDMMDAQRQFDALAAVMGQLGLGSHPLSDADYLAIQHAIQSNPANAALEELAIQGHGLNGFNVTKYNGYTNDYQANVDTKTLYVGPGLDSGQRAITNFFDDVILTHFPFPVIARNGEVEQLNQNGNQEDTLQRQVDGLNGVMFGAPLTVASFNLPGSVPIGTSPTNPPPANTTTTFFGASIPNSMTVNGHVWTVGLDGRFHTTTNLQAEWKNYYTIMLAANGATLTPIQRDEGNAEAVFENTALANITSAAKQQSYREDVQRQLDAIATTMTSLGLGANPLSAQDYENINDSLQSNAALEELAMQGHGLNNSSLTKYNGYTNDFQGGVDGDTKFVGGGEQNGKNALARLVDDVIVTHLGFPVVSVNGVLTQLNQNGNDESSLADAVAEANQAMFYQVFVASDFSKDGTTVGQVDPVYTTPPAPDPSPTPGAGQMLSNTGFVIPTTIVANGHTWIADAQSRYETSTDLTLEWWNSYQAAQAGQPLTLTQHWEADAEAVFLNTGLSRQSEGQQQVDREDTQREIDAIVVTMTTLGLGSKPPAVQDFLAIEHSLQSNPALEELALQGHGLDDPWVQGVTEYLGYTNDFQSNVDNTTLWVGGGVNTGQRAVTNYFDTSVLSHAPFPTIAINGELEQLNENGNATTTVSSEVESLDQTLFGAVDTAANFLAPGRQPYPPPAAGPTTVTTLFGDTIPATMTLNGHTWTADANGEFQTTANLEIEWRGDYQTLLAGNGASLTPTQRLEGNIEAFFENTNINFQWMGAAKEEAWREDVQREIDAIATAMQIDLTQFGTDPNASLTEASYLEIGTTIQPNAVLQEMMMQGHGVSNPPSSRYHGAYGDFLSGADWSTYFAGGGPDNGLLALPYALQNMLASFAFPAVFRNGDWQQLNMWGNVSGTVIDAATALNDAMYAQVYTAADFSGDKTATGPVVTVGATPVPAVAPISSITAPAGEEVTLTGQLISTTLIENGHTWTADGNGLYHTGNLAAEWTGLAALMATGNGASLTPFQRMEGNAETVFEATGLTKLSAAVQQQFREDVQREIDAMATAATITATTLGIPTQAVLLPGSFVPVERTLQSNAALEELAVQGFGLPVPPAGPGGGTEASKYIGYYNGFRNLSSVNYVGTGINSGRRALESFMAENIMTFTPFAVLWVNGKLMQTNQNGELVDTLVNQIQAIDDTALNKVYKASDFH